MSHARPIRFLAALLATMVLLQLTALAAEDDPPLRTEDVVRMLVSGTEASEIVSEIRSRAVEFELSPEMIDELRIAGVPDAIIRAMQERQAELHPDPSPSPDESQATEFVTEGPLLVIEIEGPAAEDTAPSFLYFPARLPAAAAQALQVGDGSEPLEVEALAIYLACRTAIHVPDYWRSQSPLGRDFVSMPRHRMIAFVRGDEKVSRADLPEAIAKQLARVPKDVGYLRLEIPPRLEAQIDLDEPHDLSFGLAIEVGGRFLRITSDDRDDSRIGDDHLLKLRAVNDPTEGGFGITATILN